MVIEPVPPPAPPKELVEYLARVEAKIGADTKPYQLAGFSWNEAARRARVLHEVELRWIQAALTKWQRGQPLRLLVRR